MSELIIDGITHLLPADDHTAQKVTPYNTPLAALGSAWASYTPTLTNAAIGTGGGALKEIKYRRIGSLVLCRLHIVLGSSGASVSGSVSFSLPVDRAAYGGTATLTPLGSCRLYDLDLNAGYEGHILTAATVSTALVVVHDASSTYLKSAVLSSTVPFTWAAGDEINAEFWYEAA